MQVIARRLSLIGRQWHSQKDRRSVLKRFALWKTEVDRLPPAGPQANRLLVVRLDDIGDYLLFRNQLAVYKQSPRWAGHHITLLGNAAWRPLFELLDAGTVDEVLWVEKNRYLENAEYRQTVWQALRRGGFETAIAPSCTRPLLLDDLCVLAAAPTRSLANGNTNVHADWNRLSDSLYGALFQAPESFMHEFHFNAAFATWACGQQYAGARPGIELSTVPPLPATFLLCFIGASTRSKRWPARRWIEFITAYRGPHEIVIAGNGAAELEMARLIQQETSVVSVVGKVTLVELLPWIANAVAVVSNDTMTAHLGVSFDVPTVIIANGLNYMRFAEYGRAGIPNVRTVYPRVALERRARHGDSNYAYSETVTADIASITAATVLDEVDLLLGSLQSAASPPTLREPANVPERLRQAF
jgi:ADP-heptose:LPS heptosyltransferase